jgi:hypothetical protein
MTVFGVALMNLGGNGFRPSSELGHLPLVFCLFGLDYQVQSLCAVT